MLGCCVWYVIGWAGHKSTVVEIDGNEQACHAIEDERPSEGLHVSVIELQYACQGNEYTLSEDKSNAVERVADAHKE